MLHSNVTNKLLFVTLASLKAYSSSVTVVDRTSKVHGWPFISKWMQYKAR